MSGLLEGTPQHLSKRRLSQETCQRWGYLSGLFKGQPVQIANYKDRDGTIVAQKLRTADKTNMPWLGEAKEAAPLFGMWMWRDGGRQVVITEGEIDALSVSQVFNHKWAVVSIKSGANAAHKDIAAAIDWLGKFERVVFMFDMDEPGQAAAKRCAALLPPGKAFIASLTEKDASDLLQTGKADEISNAAWGARPYRPDGIVTFASVKQRAMAPMPVGAPWPWPGLTSATFGRHLGTVIALGAGTGVGKTDFLAQLMAFGHMRGEKWGALFLETPPVEVAVRVAGKLAGKCFHVPDGSWSDAEKQAALDAIDEKGPLPLYDSFGAIDWPTVRGVITHLALAEGCEHIILDHLTALAAFADDEKKALEEIMAELGGLVQQHNICLYLVSHLTTPEGKSHEEGGRVTIRQFKGSRAIGFWSHYMIGLERDQQAEDEDERRTTRIRILKDRKTGRGTGKTVAAIYDTASGLLNETDNVNDSPFPSADEDF